MDYTNGSVVSIVRVMYRGSLPMNMDLMFAAVMEGCIALRNRPAYRAPLKAESACFVLAVNRQVVLFGGRGPWPFWLVGALCESARSDISSFPLLPLYRVPLSLFALLRRFSWWPSLPAN